MTPAHSCAETLSRRPKESVKQQEAEISAVKSERAESEQARAAEISSLREQIRALGDEKSAVQKTHDAVRYA